MTVDELTQQLKDRMASDGEIPQPRVIRVAPDETAQSQYPQEEEGGDEVTEPDQGDDGGESEGNNDEDGGDSDSE